MRRSSFGTVILSTLVVFTCGGEVDNRGTTSSTGGTAAGTITWGPGGTAPAGEGGRLVASGGSVSMDGGSGSGTVTAGAGPGTDAAIAVGAVAELGVATTGIATVLETTLPSALTDANWGLKQIVCQEGSYDLAVAAGDAVRLVRFDSMELCAGYPSYIWVVLHDNRVICIYKTVRESARVAPGVFSVTSLQCSG